MKSRIKWNVLITWIIIIVGAFAFWGLLVWGVMRVLYGFNNYLNGI